MIYLYHFTYNQKLNQAKKRNHNLIISYIVLYEFLLNVLFTWMREGNFEYDLANHDTNLNIKAMNEIIEYYKFMTGIVFS